jgi:hypothetical protein
MPAKEIGPSSSSDMTKFPTGIMWAEAGDASDSSNRSIHQDVPVPKLLLKSSSAASVDNLEQQVDDLESIHLETGTPMAELRLLAKQGLLQGIPRNELGQLASIGSVHHASGTCTPCVFWFKKSCLKGLTCSYCHFKHKGQKSKRIRPSKKTRQHRRECGGEYFAALGTMMGDKDSDDEDGDAVHEIDEGKALAASSSGKESAMTLQISL